MNKPSPVHRLNNSRNRTAVTLNQTSQTITIRPNRELLDHLTDSIDNTHIEPMT